MNPLLLLAIAGGALLVLGAAGKGGGGGMQTSTATKEPQRIPTTPPAPDTAQGDGRNNDQGRAWGTFYVNRDQKKHHELRVLTVAASPGNAAIGTGEVIADVYTTVIAGAGWDWQGQSCGALRFRLLFSAGHLVKTELVTNSYPGKPLPSCQSVRPTSEVFLRKLNWVQRGPEIWLTMDTDSGLNKTALHGPGWDRGNWPLVNYDGPAKWDNDYVASGDAVLDVSWIFTPLATAS